MAIWQTNGVTITGLPYIGNQINLHSVFTSASDAAGTYIFNTEIYDGVTKSLLQRISETVDDVTPDTAYTRILTVPLLGPTYAAGLLLFKQGVFQTSPSPALLVWNDQAGGVAVTLAPSWTAARYTVSKLLPVLGDTFTISTTLTAAAAGNFNVGIEARDPNGSRYKRAYNAVTFGAPGETAAISTSFTFALPGRYYFEIGVFDTAWNLVAWLTSDYFFDITGNTVAAVPSEIDPVFRRGVTISGSESVGQLPGLYGLDYQYPTALIMNYYQATGLNTLRIPFRWERLQPTLGGALDIEEVNRITTALRNLKGRGLQGLLTMHNFGGYVISGTLKKIDSSGGPTKAQFADVWKKIATLLVNEAGLYGVDLMWQVDSMPASDTWLQAAQQAIDAIRDVTGATNMNIFVQGDKKSRASRWAIDNPTFDLARANSHLFYEVVVWFDSDESGAYATSYVASGATGTTGSDRLQPFVDWLTANTGKQGFVGAYGAPQDNTAWQTVLENLLGLMDDSGLGGTAWVDGDRVGANPLGIGPLNGIDSPSITTLLMHLGQQNIF